MLTAGIIAEYNPFHNGHKYQIEKTREITNAEGIIVAMSGNFVQRGDIAICDKWSRAKMALLNGADLVVELPCVYACQSAEY
ncbi:MAG: nucleotidyltransferase family protein, partial [Clostridia bacterium]|nr:nucleotidyltransferase family protein [Clostridia bacterium]